MLKILSLLVINTFSMNVFAQNVSQATSIKGQYLSSTKAFLMHQRNPKTKILESFINTTDKELIGESSTYDQALAGLGFLELGDYDKARDILSFFREKWDGRGFPNFYNAETGLPGVEATVHLGPNMWIALFALQYSCKAGDTSFNGLAKEIALWAVNLNHKNGGLCMGPVSDWGGNWPDIYSSENNIIAYTVFKFLQAKEENEAMRNIFTKEMQGIISFINNVTLKKNNKGKLINVSVGYNPKEGVSSVSSSDVVTMLLLAFNPDELEKFFSLDEAILLKFAKDNFYVCVDGICGLDFTNESSAESLSRPRMISLEWTAQMADAQISLAQFYEKKASLDKAASYLKESGELSSSIDTKAINDNNMSFFPYATKESMRPFPFAYWWKTPKGDVKLCGALSSTLWRFFVHKKFNPMQHLFSL